MIIWQYSSKDEAYRAGAVSTQSPELVFTPGYDKATRSGNNVKVKAAIRIFPRNNGPQSANPSAQLNPVRAALIINGTTQWDGIIANSLPKETALQNVDFYFPEITLNNPSQINVKVKLHGATGSTSSDVRNVTSNEKSLEVPPPTSSITLVDSDPTSATFNISNLSSNYTCSVKIGDKYLDVSGLSDSETKLGTTIISNITDPSFFSSTSLTKSFNCVITTYEGSTVIGQTTQTITFELPKDKAKPTLVFTSADYQSEYFNLTGDLHKFIEGKTTINARTRFTTIGNATVSNITVNGTTMSNNVAKPVGIANSSKIIINCVSRGITWEYTETIDLIPYSKPTISPNVRRTDGVDDNDAIIIDNSGTWTNVNFGAVANTLTLQYRTRLAGGTWTDYQNTAAGPTTSSNNWTYYNDNFGAHTFDYNKDYEIQFKLIDKLETVETAAILIPKSVPIADWGENDFHFHVPVNFDSKSNQPIIINGLDLWDWIQKVEEFIHPPKPDIPDPVEGTISVPGNGSNSVQLAAEPIKIEVYIPAHSEGSYSYGDTPTHTWTKATSGTAFEFCPPGVTAGNGWTVHVTLSSRAVTLQREGRSTQNCHYKIYFKE